ncbi:hypothetical protein SDRG_01314 [Saprolegnia diclina VS20]|uniref:Cyclic nucleotide-binding domain-containing protein n=1 Tax=Saprolegnia diclina (strain VS20) TaxID=1156394 RepID=T0R4P6_SAPDV|nr:hypothetical protein SDRG_01314 [Saprolegnia diclina VS20]EQC41340.1 hypothetical protein SDRG_01314 [Saprolegnia diclina VS20]|eukprot:XP_008605054.1 hypothetical protein SDRG_01314 [Saprolegnia diclina VS20]
MMLWSNLRGYLQRKATELRFGNRSRPPRRRVHRVVARRKYGHLREFLYVLFYNFQLLCYLFFIPLRLGFVFDPFVSHADPHFDANDGLFYVVDVVTDVFGLVNFYFLSRYHRGLYNRPMSFSQHSSHTTTATRAPGRLASMAARATNEKAVKPESGPIAARHLHFMGTVSGRSLAHISRFQLLLEAAALIPFEFVCFAAFGINGLHLARIPKLLRLHNGRRCLAALKTVLSRYQCFARLNNTPVSFLVMLMVTHFSLFHLVSAAYMLLAHVECGVHLDQCEGGGGASSGGHRQLSGGGASLAVGTPTCWVLQGQLQGGHIWDQYIRTLVTVAFGDAFAYTYAEGCFGILIQLLRALMSCAIIGGFELVFGHYNSRRSTYVALLEDARTYTQSRKLPENLRIKILGYFDYFWRVQLGILENNVIASLPAHFQMQCTQVLKASLISKVYFLTKESANVIQNLASLLTSQVFMPMDWITKTVHFREMYLIARGKVFLVDDNQKIISKLTQGDAFGEITLFVENAFAYKALAETFCELYQLNTDVFHTVIDAYYTETAVAAQRKTEWRDAIEARDHQMLKTQKLLNQGETLQSVMRHAQSKSGRWVLPHSKFRSFWSMLHLCSLIYMAVEIPYKLIFRTAENIDTSTSVTLVFVASVLNEFFYVLTITFEARYFAFLDTSSVVTTAPVTDPDLIFAHYKESNAWRYDLIAILPIAIIGDALPYEWSALVLYLRLFRLLRLVRLRQLQDVLSGVLEEHRVSSALQTVVYLSLGVLLVTHVAGCLWFLIANVQTPHAAAEATHWTSSEITRARCSHDGGIFANCTWFLYDQVHHPHNSEYARALLWSVVSLTTVGFGPILPFSTAEYTYACLWFYVSCLINFGVIGAISSAIAQMMANENRSQDRLMQINRFMRYRSVSPLVQHQVRRYYKNQWVREKGVNEEAFLTILPDNLQHEILTFLHAQTFERMAIFDGVSDECKQIIATIIRHETYQAGDVIAHQGDMGADLYVVRNGTVEVFEKTTPIQVLHAGACFGEANFVLEIPYAMSIRAMTATELSVLRRHEFEQIIKFYPEEWEIIYEQGIEVHESVDAAWSTIKANLTRDKIVSFAKSTTTLFVMPPRDAGVIPPQSRVRRVWEAVVVLLMVYNAVQIIFRISFLRRPSDAAHTLLTALDYLCDVIFLVDIYLKYNHFTYDNESGGNLSRSESRQHYRSHYLVYDVAASAPIYYVGDPFTMTLCRLPRLLRCLQLPELIDAIQLGLQERFVSARVTAGLRLSRLLLILTIFAHYTGAFFFIISSPDGYLPHTEDLLLENEVMEWHLKDPIIKEYPGNALVVYLRTLYWAVTAVTATDYRDIDPITNIPTYYTSITCFAGFFFVGQVIGRLTSIIANMDKEAHEFELRIDNYNEYGRSQKLPKFLLERGHEYFEFQFECTRGMEADTIFADLPHSLRLKLYFDLYGKRLREISLFLSFDAASLAAIAERLFPVLYLPHDNILVEGGTGVSLFIMNQGRAEQYVRACNLVVAAVPEGCLFGEVAFFMPDLTHLTSVRASTCCEVFRLERADWLALWPDDRRSELEAEISPQLVAKHEYLKVALTNILTNLTYVDGVSSPNQKARKHMMSNNLRRLSSYGQRRLNVMRTTLHTLRFKKSNTSRVLPVANDAEPNDVGPERRLSRQKVKGRSFRERSMSVIQQKIQAVKTTSELRKKLIADQRRREQRTAVIMRSLTRQEEDMDDLDEDELDDDDDENDDEANHQATNNHGASTGRVVDAGLVMHRSSWVESRDKVLEVGSTPEVTPRIEDILSDKRQTSGHFDHLDVLRRASLRLQTPIKGSEAARISIWAEVKMPPWWTHPHSTFRASWDQLLFGITLYYAIALPLRACFVHGVLLHDVHGVDTWIYTEYLLDVLSLIDVVLRWGYFCRMIRGELESDPTLLRAEYFHKDGYVYDVIAAVPFELFALVIPSSVWGDAYPLVHSVSLLRLNKLARLVHVPAYSTKARELLTLRFKSISWLGLFLSFLNIWGIFLLCGHWIACIWYYVSLHSSLTSPSTLVSAGHVSFAEPLSVAYLRTYYFAATTLTSVAFGDSRATTLMETIVTIGLVFVGLLAYGILTGGLSEIFEEEFKNLVKFEDHLGVVSTFLVHRQFPRPVILQIMEYFRMLWERSEGIVENKALAPLSSAIREDIAVYVKRDLITKVQLFAECDQDFTRAIVAMLQAEFYVAKDVIIREGDYERSMYFIHMGFILVTNNAKSYEVVKQKGDYFGERSLLHNTPRSATCSAISNCEMYILEHSAYEYTLERFPEYRARNLKNWCSVPLLPTTQSMTSVQDDESETVGPSSAMLPEMASVAEEPLSSPKQSEHEEVDPNEKIRRLSNISQLHSFSRRPMYHDGTPISVMTRAPSLKKLVHAASHLDLVSEVPEESMPRSSSAATLVTRQGLPRYGSRSQSPKNSGWSQSPPPEAESHDRPMTPIEPMLGATSSNGVVRVNAAAAARHLLRSRTEPRLIGQTRPRQLQRSSTDSNIAFADRRSRHLLRK